MSALCQKRLPAEYADVSQELKTAILPSAFWRGPRIPASWKATLTDNIEGLAPSTAAIIRKE